MLKSIAIIALFASVGAAQITTYPPAAGGGTFVQLSGDASSTATGGATVVNGLKGVPFCTGYTPTNGQMVEYTTALSPNPCYTAAAGSTVAATAADQLLGSGASTTLFATPAAVPNCGAGYALQYATATHAFSCGAAGGSTRTWPFSFQGIVQAGGAAFAANLPASGAPTPTNIGGTDPASVLEWPIGQNSYYAWWNWKMPTGYTSNAAISYSVDSQCNTSGTCDSTHAAILTPYWSCTSTATPNAPSWTAVSTVNITNSAAGAVTTTTGTITPTCAAGNRAYVKLKIDTGTNSLTGPFDLISVTFAVQGGI